MNFVELTGYAAAASTTIAFLPQVIRTWRTRSAKDLSLGMALLMVTGTTLWLAYGLLTHSGPMIAANVLSLVLTAVLLYFKLSYK